MVDGDIYILVMVGAAILCFIPYISHALSIATTIIHELGHVIVVYPFGGRTSFVKGIKLRANSEGDATVMLPKGRMLRVVNLFSGYAAPIWFAFFLALCVASGWSMLALGVLAAASAFLIAFVRNITGILIALLFAAANGGFIFFAHEQQTLVNAYLLGFAAMLLVNGLRDIRSATKDTRRGFEGNDFGIAARELPGSPLMWNVTFLIVHAFAWLVVAFFLFPFVGAFLYAPTT